MSDPRKEFNEFHRIVRKRGTVPTTHGRAHRAAVRSITNYRAPRDPLTRDWVAARKRLERKGVPFAVSKNLTELELKMLMRRAGYYWSIRRRQWVNRKLEVYYAKQSVS